MSGTWYLAPGKLYQVPGRLQFPITSAILRCIFFNPFSYYSPRIEAQFDRLLLFLSVVTKRYLVVYSLPSTAETIAVHNPYGECTECTGRPSTNTSEYQSLRPLVPLGFASTQSGTCEDSALPAPGTLGTREDPVTSAPDALGTQYLKNDSDSRVNE